MATRQDGFSLLELIIATTVIGVLAVVVSGFYTNRLVDYARNNTLIILQSNTKQALESMQRDVRAARALEVVNAWPDANGPGGNQYGWASNSNSPSIIVMAVPTTDISGELQYIDVNHTALQTNDVIYYVDSAQKTLFRRVIVNPICLSSQGGNGSVNCSAVSTCPPAATTANCPPDGKVIEDVANLTATYYDTSNAVTTSVNNIYSVDVTLTQSRDRFGNTYTNTLSSRITLRNKP